MEHMPYSYHRDMEAEALPQYAGHIGISVVTILLILGIFDLFLS
jgi:hypothetical protein